MTITAGTCFKSADLQTIDYGTKSILLGPQEDHLCGNRLSFGGTEASSRIASVKLYTVPFQRKTRLGTHSRTHMMARHHPIVPSLLLSFSLFLLYGNCAPVAALTDDAETITCLGGWTGDSQQSIPKAWINDGYCDCPFDGKDEPNTNACSGSSDWAGVSAATERSPKTETNHFVCPQQPDLVLPASKMNDGICDCCDGKDEEQYIVCPDICYEVLRAERERSAKISNDYLIGSRKRDTELNHFSKARTSKVAEVSKMVDQLDTCNADIDLIVGTKIAGLKRQYVLSRMATMKDNVVMNSMATELLIGLGNTELEELIIHLCQISGEIAKSDGAAAADGNACSALRVAAMDLGLSWNDQEDFETTMNGKVDMTPRMVEIIFGNAIDTDYEDGLPALPPLRWKLSSGRKGRRRLDESSPMDDDDFPMNDEFMDEDDDYDSRNPHIDEETDDTKGKEKDFVDEIQNSAFSRTRANFLTQSQEILDEINKMSDIIPPEDSDEAGVDGKEGIEDIDGDESKAAPDAKNIVDSVASTKARTYLRRNREIIRKGFRWGASAKLLCTTSPLRDSNEHLKRLAIGTIFYGQISAIQVWQILLAIVPEYKSLSKSIEENTCASPWAEYCPPKQIYRKSLEGSGDTISETEYPPSFLIHVAKSFCDEETLKFGKDGSGASACSKGIDAVVASSGDLFGYSIPTKRHQENDPFQVMFNPIFSIPIDTEGLRSLEDEKKTKETEKHDLTEAIDKIWKEVGGKDGTQLGHAGELSSIASECFEIVAAKYTYELCMFGKAQQTEGSNKSGTNLGHFEGIEYINSNDSAYTSSSRVLKWTNGAKCWKGPKRSATIYMKCGVDHKIISSDEPETCRYVFEMESYLACDDDYKRLMGL